MTAVTKIVRARPSRGVRAFGRTNAERYGPADPTLRKIRDLMDGCRIPDLMLMSRLGPVRVAFFNEASKLGGSHKVHLVAQHLYDAFEVGTLRVKGAVVIPSSGSTGITTAVMCRRLGFSCTVVVPEGTSTAKIRLLSQAQATAITAPTLDRCVERAREIAAASGAMLLDQFAPTPARTLGRSMARLHFDAVERHFGQAPDETVVTFGTGATAVTFRREVTSRGFDTRIADAAVAGGVSQSFYQSGDRSLRGQVPHRIEGVNTSFVPNSACRTAVDDSMPIDPAAAFAACLEMKGLGLDCGPSSGLAIYCALVRAQQRQDAGVGGLISVPIYDGSARYPDTLLNLDYLASLEPALTSYRRQIRIFTRSEIWMPLNCCGQIGEHPGGTGGAQAAGPVVPTMWPIEERAA